MKKIICLLLSAAILLLSSCGIHGQEESAVAPFYYLRDPDTFDRTFERKRLVNDIDNIHIIRSGKIPQTCRFSTAGFSQ